jgi:hypothetical protein
MGNERNNSMKVLINGAKVSGNITGVVSEIKVFRIEDMKKSKCKDVGNGKNYVFEMTDAEYSEWFRAYYGYEVPCSICDFCNADMTQDEKTFLVVHDIGNAWLEPRYGICSKCRNKII